MSVLGTTKHTPSYFRQILLVSKAWDFGAARCCCSLAVVHYSFARAPSAASELPSLVNFISLRLCARTYPLLDKQNPGAPAGMPVAGEVDLRWPFRFEKGGNAFDFGESRFLNALVLQPCMKDASP